MRCPRVPDHPRRSGLPTFQPGKTLPGVIASRFGAAAWSISWSRPLSVLSSTSAGW